MSLIALSSIYRLPLKFPAEHSRSAGRAAFKCPRLRRLAPWKSEREPKTVFPQTKQLRCCTDNTAARRSLSGTFSTESFIYAVIVSVSVDLDALL